MDREKARWGVEWVQPVHGPQVLGDRDLPVVLASFQEGQDPFVAFLLGACPRAWDTLAGVVQCVNQVQPFPSYYAFQDACLSFAQAGGGKWPMGAVVASQASVR